MDESDLLTRLEELVLEENRIVTVKGFSQYCEIHVNRAKYVMSKFKENHKDDIVACFMVVGYKIVDNQRSISVVLSKEDEVDNVKSNLTSILSNSIYSISKTYPKCQSDLYASEVSLCGKNEGVTVPPVVSDPKITIREKLNLVTIPRTVSNIESNVKGNFANAFEPTEKKKPQKTSGIAAAFAKTTVKNSSPEIKNESTTIKDQEKKCEPEVKKIQQKDSNNKTKRGAMMAFVQKGVVNTKSAQKDEKKVEPTDVKKLEKDIWSDSSEEEDKEDPLPPKKATIVQKKPAKKMKRIIMVSSSESEDDIEEKIVEISKEKSRKTLTETKNKDTNKEKEETVNKTVKDTKKRKTADTERKMSMSSDNEDPFPKKKDDRSEEKDIPKAKSHKTIEKVQKQETAKKNAKETKKKKTVVKVEQSKRKKRKLSMSSDDEDPLPKKKVDLSEEEDIENNMDDVEDTKPPAPVNKRLKTVKTTYQDEHGFLVTRNEKCLVEVQPEEKVEKPSSPLKGASSKNENGAKKNKATKQKQASISSFFKKF